MAIGPNNIIKGAMLYVLMRWTDRLIGFISTLILARLLVPADFGIIAMTSLVIGLADVLLDLGVNVALIQNRQPSQDHYNTAWTLRLLQATGTVLMIAFVAPYAGVYFHDERVTLVLRIMSIGSLIAACENIGIVSFQKEMRADLDFIFTFSKRIGAFLATVLIAWLLHSYWAMIIGTLFGRVIGVVLSYLIHPMRPRLSLKKFGEIFGVSQWMLANSVGNYMNSNLHKLLVGRHTSTTSMGGYTLADEISAMPSTEILSPLNRVLFPAFVRAKHDLEELKRTFLIAQGVQSMIAIPASLGLALVASDAVMVLLGAKWMLVVPFIQVLALSNVVQAITTSSGYVLLALAQNRSATMTTWTQLVLFAVIALFFMPTPQAIDYAWLRVVSAVAGLVIAVWMLMRNMKNIRLFEMFNNVIRPAVATGIMAVAIVWLHSIMKESPLVSLATTVCVGILTYSSSVLLIWLALGRPAGAESYLLDKITDALSRHRS